jgi:hypothetical protein
MMILEMVAGRKNIDAGFKHSSEIYFPHWIHKHIELEGDLKLLLNMDKAGKELARKMILVGLWGIQSNPANRPSMDKVVDMLEGSHEVLFKYHPSLFLLPLGEVQQEVPQHPLQILSKTVSRLYAEIY